ncbi:patatin-like phospholipase family protein [Desulfobacterales bacterium HSG16]|nr:patatin-like phospholipase family protein [Desulfobacterales bacterium HSG16]
MSENLIFMAGKNAFAKIRENGLSPDDIAVMTGAAGGPKWLVMSNLDRFLFSSWFKDRKKPLYLIGSSSGSWRFASVSQADPLSAIDRFQYAYTRQQYDGVPSPEIVSQTALEILDHILLEKGAEEILAHPFIRMCVMTVRCKGLAANDKKSAILPAMAAAFILNGMSRKWLKFFFERAFFHDLRDKPPYLDDTGIKTEMIPMTRGNLKFALLASGSIPLVMSGVKNISGAPDGTYRDGGVIDYHMDLPINPGQGIIFFPHYTNTITPGWLDKKLSWRRPQHLDNTLMVAPSEKFVKKLPYEKIPDRNDFHKFEGRDKERIKYWEEAVELNKCLADEFNDAVSTGKIANMVRLMK